MGTTSSQNNMLKEQFSGFTSDVLEQICPTDSPCKFYVYRLIDPRTFQTFYVGKGTGNRVFDHSKAALKSYEKNQDAQTEKIQIIQKILSEGKEVICVIHRWGLTNNEAREVESALIDAYPGLANIQSGYNPERGVITAAELQQTFSATAYEEIDEKYIIIKTTHETISKNGGSVYEATRRSWKRKINSVKRFRHVLAVVNGVVREVYDVTPDEWSESQSCQGRVEFDNGGRTTTNQKFKDLIGKRIPAKYRKRGMASPILFSKN